MNHSTPNPHLSSTRDRQSVAYPAANNDGYMIYDARRLPKHGINVVVIPYTAFGSTKKIVRNPQSDKLAIMRTLKENGIDL
jgi:hypothetical protein